MKKKLVLFDVDGTLTLPRQKISNQMNEFIFKELTKFVDIGIIGGSDLNKQKEQLCDDILLQCIYNFSENGLVAYKNGNLIGKKNIVDYLGEENIKKIINWTLKYIADLDIPIKRGTFIEFRSGMINISPIGRNCNKEERDEFEKFDKINEIRKKMISELNTEFSHLDLVYSIGGQISFDLFPKGCDKTLCLNYINLNEYDSIHFFGDKTEFGGNDYEIYNHPRIIGHSIKSPDETKLLCEKLFIN